MRKQTFMDRTAEGFFALIALSFLLFIIGVAIYQAAYATAWVVSNFRPEDFHAQVSLKSVDHDWRADAFCGTSRDDMGCASVEVYTLKIDQLPGEKFEVSKDDIEKHHLTVGSKVLLGYKRILDTNRITTWQAQP